VGSVVWVQTSYTFQQCQHPEKRLRFHKVTESLKVGIFFRDSVEGKHIRNDAVFANLPTAKIWNQSQVSIHTFITVSVTKIVIRLYTYWCYLALHVCIYITRHHILVRFSIFNYFVLFLSSCLPESRIMLGGGEVTEIGKCWCAASDIVSDYRLTVILPKIVNFAWNVFIWFSLISAGALPQTPLGEFIALPRPLAGFEGPFF